MTSTGVFSEQIRDTTWHNYPDAATYGSGYETDRGHVLVKVMNSLDQSLTVTLHGTTFDDPEMKEVHPDSAANQGVSVAAGSTEIFTTDKPWSYVRVAAQAGTAPTSGSLDVVIQSEN